MIRRPKSVKRPKAAANSGGRHRALVLVDGSKTRQRVKLEYENALHKLTKARAQLEQHQKSDLPQFTQWLSRNFGAIMTEVRELGQKLSVLESIIFSVEGEVFISGMSHAKAYRKVMEARDNPNTKPPPSDDGGDVPEDEEEFREPKSKSRKRRSDKDSIEDLLEDFFESFGNGRDSRDVDREEKITRKESSKTSRLKELYRLLARRLHPDAQREMTPQKIEWWHQAQTAYEAGDVDQLEVILALCDISENEKGTFTSVSVLQRIIKHLKASFFELRSELNELKHHPAWNFSKLTNYDLLAKRVRKDMQSELNQMRSQHEFLKQQVEEWKAASERTGRTRRKPRKRRTAFDENMPF